MVARLPATVTVILAAVEELLTEHGPMTEEHLLVALHDAGVDLGRDPAETLSGLLDADELPLVMPLSGDRHALLPALLDGRVFTHRLSAAEIEHGLVTVSPDFEPLSMLADNEPYGQLLDGEPLVEIFPDLDGLAHRGMPVNAIQDAPASSSRRIGWGRWACAQETWSDSASPLPGWTSPASTRVTSRPTSRPTSTWGRG